MTLERAAGLVPYLAGLGVSHLYTSPAATATPGSSHGYDVADPTRVDDAIGGADGHRRLSEALFDAGLGRLVDIVPNHVAAHGSNPWWSDVLEKGAESGLARYFDVDWDAGDGRIVDDPAAPNYRRFFDISGLVGVRVEETEVFDRAHSLVLEWLASGEADGLRVDHPDGLRHPAEYFEQLRQASHGAWTVVEKILAPDEELPAGWAVDGTTGYEYCRRVTGLHVSGDAEAQLTDLYAELTGASTDWEQVSRQGRLDVLAGSLAPDLDRLARRAAEAEGRPQDEAREDLRQRLSTFPVYRDYPPPDAPDWQLRFSQLCAAVTAKGIEDTAFYRFTRFCALNEVGGEPGRFGTGLEEFHAANEAAQQRPLTMLSTATHDTKWGEDVRARMCVLSEVPEEWAAVARRWMADRRLSVLEPTLAYGLLQALVGAWPLPADRALGYVAKAARESKTVTSWAAPDEDYERRVETGVRELLADPAFEAELASFARPIAAWGRINSLATTLLKLTSPGVPDIYQGTELWDDSLVDPDNRRPVDFALRERLAGRLRGVKPEEAVDQVLGGLEQGLPKLWVTMRALALRTERSEVFGPGASYGRVETVGPWAERVVAFSRSDEVVSVAPRLSRGPDGKWESTQIALPSGQWTNVLTGESLRGGKAIDVAELWRRFPVALLTTVPSS